jgi:putative thioredoxin
MLSVTAENFAREVLQTSRIMPVVVDFWGEECGPCKALAPVLERLEPEYAGRLKIVKLDAGLAENRELTMRLGVRGVPTLVAFGGGEPVRRAVGNVPEPELRHFFDAALAGPGDAQATYRSAVRALEEGDRARAIAALREAVKRDPAHMESRLALLLELGRAPGPADEKSLGKLNEELWIHFPQLAAQARHSYPFEVEALQLRINCLNDRSVMPAMRALRGRLDAAPEDDWTRLTLARRLIAEGEFKEAAERLLQGLERGDAHSGYTYFRSLRSVHILEGTWDDATANELGEIMERVEASRKGI